MRTVKKKFGKLPMFSHIHHDKHLSNFAEMKTNTQVASPEET